jgi:uncharacterized protein (TIGR03089 family)
MITAAMSELISGRFRRWVRERGASPLLTYYDLATGERTELSGVSVANWVDKTSNLLVDELGVEQGEAVELALAESNPGHWVTMVWQLACWQVGAVVTLGRLTAAAVVVAGPGGPGAVSTPGGTPPAWVAPGTQVLVCSLHPLGLPLTEPPPAGVLDYALEVRGQPDQHAALPQSGPAPAWHDPARQLSQAELLMVEATARRRLIRPDEAWPTARAGLIAPLLGAGSSVVVAGTARPEQLAHIADQEQAELPTGG